MIDMALSNLLKVVNIGGAMTYKVLKEHKFEAAHRLVRGYPGNCAHIHGHSWVVRFECSGEKLDQYGMLRDFGDFKAIRKWIDENLDHATMVCDEDDSLIQFLEANKQRMFVFNENPTSENLAYLLLKKGRALGIDNLTAVEVNETCTSCARYEYAAQD